MHPNLSKYGILLSFISLVSATGLYAAEKPVTAQPQTDRTQNPDTDPATGKTRGNVERRKSIAKYEEQIQKHQAEHGVYDPATGEYLLSVGLVHQRDGNHEQAIKMLSRALQIKRVNEGLHSTGQLIILERLLKSNIAASNWVEVDRNYHQLLWIYKRNYADDDPLLLPIIDKVGRWKLKAYEENLLEDNALTTIGESERLFTDTISILQRQYGEHDPRLVDPLYGRALTNYQYAIEAANTPQDKFHGTGSPTRTQVVCRTVPTANGGIRRICNTIRTPDPGYYASQSSNKQFALEQRIQAVGRALKQIVQIHNAHPGLPEDSHARALVHLGDWNLLRGKKSTANKNYKTAYEILSSNNAYSDLLKEMFGKPQNLPALRLPLPEVDEKLDEEKITTTVLASFDVSRTGRARNIQIIESDPVDATSARRKTRKTIKGRLYRPRFENGEPVETLNNRIRVAN